MTTILAIVPVLPSSNILRDVEWYTQRLGFLNTYIEDGYAVLKKQNITLHLQEHAGTDEDPIVGSVVKITVDDIQSAFKALRKPLYLTSKNLQLNTPWGTHEFGCYDLNKNALIFVQNL